ncbi:MAG TPA: histidine kinase [Chitinophagales bacterium]|nr:histidine kinase [Chitinophagales bacterium]
MLSFTNKYNIGSPAVTSNPVNFYQLSTAPLSVNRLRLSFIAFWIIWSVVHVVVIHSLGFSWQLSIIDSSVMNATLAAACLLVSNNLRYYLPQQHRYWYILLWSIGLSALWMFICRGILMHVIRGNETYLSLLNSSVLIRSAIAFLLIGCMAIASVLWYTLQEQKENEQRKADAERLSRDAELFNLRQQLQPHFLFNSLNSINALIGSRPEEARKMIQQLADFLRGTLRKDERQWVLLSEELNHLQLYLDIEKVRFGHRLTTEITIDTDSEKLRLPALLLQPIVENAIKFGLYDTTEAITIRIQSKMEHEQLVIIVKNPYDPATAAAAGGTGFGLNSVQRRLFLLFGRNDLLTTATGDHLFTTTIKIPQQHD